MNLPNNKNDYSEGSSISLDLESLNIEYKNLLIEYKQSVLNYVNYLKEDGDNSMQSLKGRAFWGETSIAENNLLTLQDCEASCSSTQGCTGATFNKNDHAEPICALRGGDGNIVNGLPNDYAIIPKGKLLLTIVNDINDKLTKINQKILSKIDNSQSVYTTNMQQNKLKNTELKDQYKKLILDRNNIKKMINEYKTLDQKQVQGNIIINQNYYSFILLMGLVVAVIFILYKFSDSNKLIQTSNLVQSGGYISSNTSYIIFGIILLIVIYFLTPFFINFM